MLTDEVSCPLCPIAPQRLVQPPRPYGLWRCEQCGLLYASPRPMPAETRAYYDAAYFRTYYGESIEEFRRNQGPLYQRILEFNRKRLAILSRFAQRGRLLDVGAGQGLFLEVARAAGFEIAGCDVSPHVAHFHAAQGIDFRCGFVEEAGFAPGSFDVVTLWQTLEHTLDPVRTMSCARDLLRPGGLALVSVPNAAGLMARLRFLLGKPFLAESSAELHYYHFTPCSLARVLEAVGLRLIHRDAEAGQERRPLHGALERLGDRLHAWAGLELENSLTYLARRPPEPTRSGREGT